MYPLLFGLDGGLIFVSTICFWIAASRASRMSASSNRKTLVRRGRTALAAGSLGILAAVGRIVVFSRMHQELGWMFTQEKWLVHLPLLLLSAFAAVGLAFPRIARMIRVASPARVDAPIGDELRAEAGHPLLATPIRAAAWLSGLSLFFLFAPPVPFRLGEILIPLAAAAALIACSAYHQRRRNRNGPRGEWLRMLGTLAVTAALVAGWMFFGSLGSKLPGQMSMMTGSMDFGGGVPSEHRHDNHGTAVPTSVETLTGPWDRMPDRKVTLTAEKKLVTLPNGRTMEAWTYNGQLPGPELRFEYGQLVEVTLANKDIEAGVTLHWHGLNVPNAEDGVAGATQDAVMPGERHVYRFVADQTGTYWYHTHQHSAEGVKMGLFGALIVDPKPTAEQASSAERLAKKLDVTVMTHEWQGYGIAIGDPLDGEALQRVPAEPGTTVRLRLINTDNWVQQVYRIAGAPFRVVAIDGVEWNEPSDLTDARLELTTGGRYDVEFVMPEHPVYLAVGSGAERGILFGADGEGEAPPVPEGERFNPAFYGKPAPLPYDLSSEFDREFTMILDNKLGFYNGTFEQLYTINGHVFPNTPMFMVREGDLVKTTIVNRGMVDHPMHLHGHHMLVLSQNGEPVGGSPWYSDTLYAAPGDTYEVAFLADNPGVWMDHCHNLIHAAIGMSMHLAYEGVVSPFEIGNASVNRPE